jgi:N-acetylneuraminate lyase
MKHINGIVPACVTPFDDEYNINYDLIPELVEYYINAGVSGLFINGSSAEFLTLSVEERKKVAETYVKMVDNRLPIIVYVGAKNIESVKELAGHAETLGVHAVASQPPLDRANSTIDKDFVWYKEVGKASSLPLYIYLRSDMGSSEIRPNEFLKRMESIPTFTGIKFGASNFHITQGIARQTNNEINILTGPDELMLAGLVMGSDGAVGTTYNAFPKHAVKIYQKYIEGDIHTAEKLQAQLGEVIDALIDMGIVLAGTKAIMREHGMNVGQCRPSATYGMTQSAHTEKTFTDHVTDIQLKELMKIVDKYDLC